MDHALYVSMTGAKQIMQAQTVNNNNIANSSTTGFRADTTAFSSEPIYGPGYATRVNAVAADSGVDYSVGTIETTGSPLDLAVNGNGFIAVQGANGQEAYTRAGALRISDSGALITAGGQPVLSESGPVQIPPATSVTVGTDGTVSVVPLGLAAAAQSQVDRIKLVNPATKTLKKGTDGLFYLTAGGKSPTDETVHVSSGALESSNVNAAMSLVSMIQLQRLYEFQIKSMNSADTNEQSAERMMSTS
jgi:flagellar basal-body rod protein FlgF